MFDPTLKQCTTLFVNQNLVYISYQFIGQLRCQLNSASQGKEQGTCCETLWMFV